ncbi:MAG TPA: hypothetical protein VK957_00805, partial [Lunatimonas sp.]|nr:hypothetical protein [Lunatimonas sp.]
MPQIHALSFAVTLFLCQLFVISSPSFSQTTHTFTKGLAIQNQHRYGREVIFTDHLAHQLAAGTFQEPKEGLPVTPDTEDVWQTLKADETGKFRGRVRAGYLYL